MPPSSMTKLMTAYIVYEQLKAGAEARPDAAGQREGVADGRLEDVRAARQQVKVEDLIRGMIVQSGNDACIVLAEGIAGSEEQFVEMMNAEAKKIGLTNSHFMNAPAGRTEDHDMSARDIATLAAHIIHDFPEYYHYDSKNIQIQQHRAGQPESAGAEGARRTG